MAAIARRWQIGDKVFRMGAGVFVSVYVARYLGPRGLGLLSFGTALATLEALSRG